ncbi:MAG: amidohydrolase [Bacteroidales bacterium]
MKNNFTVAAIQMDLVWENYEANLQKMEYWVEKYASKAELIVFPEMFLTGFSMNVKFCSISPTHPYIDKIRSIAQQYKLAIVGSIMTVEDGLYFNRFYFFNPNGILQTYNKRHLFRMAKEHEYYSAGVERKLIDFNQNNLMPAICYDLRFPVWLRNKNNYDVLIVVANWPQVRIDAWQKLLMARAVENQCYVVAVNRCGIDGKGIEYNGASMIIDFKGNIIVAADDHIEMGIVAELNASELNNFREAFPSFMDTDMFEIKL